MDSFADMVTLMIYLHVLCIYIYICVYKSYTLYIYIVMLLWFCEVILLVT